MELELLNQITGTGANGATMLFAYILWRHDLRIGTLEDNHKKGAS